MKRIISFIIIFLLTMPLIASANGMLSQCALHSPGTSASDWSAIALLVSEKDFDKSSYIKSLKTYIQNKYLTEQKLSAAKSTEWHRITLAVTLAGEDASNFDGINLINDGVFFRENLGRQGVNAYIWALIAVNCGNYPEPDEALTRIDDIIDFILAAQNTDGSFSLKKDSADCDITAMAIYALSAYMGRGDVAHAIERAVSFLSTAQNTDGSFSSADISNAETTAQVIIALSALGIDVKTDSRFPLLYDALLSFRTTDGFSHTYGADTDIIATYQSECALVAAEKQKAIYVHKVAPIEEFETELKDEYEKEPATISVKAEPIVAVATEAVEEETIYEEPTIEYTQFETQIVTEQSDEEHNAVIYYIFPAVLIVIIIICGIIRRKR